LIFVKFLFTLLFPLHGSFIAVYQACTNQKARRAKLININYPRVAKLYFVVQ